MKKTFLTFVAVAFGTCVAFAQTTPETDQTTNTEQSVTIDRMSDTAAEEAGRRDITVEELPEAVQKSLAGDEFKSWTVVTVTELQPVSRNQNMSNTSVASDAATGNAEAQSNADAQPQATVIQYEVELMPATGQEQAAGVTEEDLEEGTETEAGATTAAPEASVVVVRFDSEGKMLSRVDRSAGASQGNE